MVRGCGCLFYGDCQAGMRDDLGFDDNYLLWDTLRSPISVKGIQPCRIYDSSSILKQVPGFNQRYLNQEKLP